ncbi:tyrosine phosphatase family protein [Methylobacterium sp. J-076]|uniref:tyrosine phosphatase family protein n=1 Tax=Methylobacterium sp. J-076 TaxID=2836655 RepID=UPI001FBAAE09|nr:tyrosine phosphatase family protein [Methylobacterium sp. J-076]MCJ2011127.1 tyrosine phosphatase family protein [Methylobacterium sp. J-076]
MPTLHVCPLSRLPETVSASGASHVLTLITAGTPLERPGSVAPENHAVIGVSDIATPREGHILAGEDHVAGILAFVRGWPRERPLVIHCYAGISRSPAAAYIAACALAPERDEDEVADALRIASPSATPNRRFVEIADRLLGRSGRMVAAIERIGRGADAFEGTPFTLTLA